MLPHANGALDYVVVVCHANGRCSTSTAPFDSAAVLARYVNAQWTAHLRGWINVRHIVVIRADGLVAHIATRNIRSTTAFLREVFGFTI